MKIFLYCLLFIGFTSNAWAYLDPGTGSYLIQVIVGVAAGAVFTIRQYWTQIVAFWHKIRSKKKE